MNPFAVSNNSQVVCIFHVFLMLIKIFTVALQLNLEARSVAEVDIYLYKDMVLDT